MCSWQINDDDDDDDDDDDQQHRQVMKLKAESHVIYLRVADWLVVLCPQPVVIATTDAASAPVLGAGLGLAVNMSDYD